MLDNANLIRKTRFPRQLVPLSVVGAHLVSFAAMLAILLVVNFIALSRVRATEWLAIPLAVLAVGFVAGIALTAASLNAIFRDVEFIVAALLVPWFFLTPVIYPLSTLARHQHVVWAIHWLNPLSPIVTVDPRAALLRRPAAARGHDLRDRRVLRLARDRRLGVQARRRSDRDRSLTTSRPSNIDGSSPSGTNAGSPATSAFGSSGGSSEGQTSGCGKRGWRPPPGAYGSSSALLRRSSPRSGSTAPPTAE